MKKVARYASKDNGFFFYLQNSSHNTYIISYNCVLDMTMFSASWIIEFRKTLPKSQIETETVTSTTTWNDINNPQNPAPQQFTIYPQKHKIPFPQNRYPTQSCQSLKYLVIPLFETMYMTNHVYQTWPKKNTQVKYLTPLNLSSSPLECN